MAVVFEHRNPKDKVTVRIHDDCLESPREQQERYDRVFDYVQRAYERAWLKAHGYTEDGEKIAEV